MVLAHFTTLPYTLREAMWRGARGRCPRCEGAPLFRKWLKPHDRCPACGIDWSPQRADDFPAYIAIFATGHLLAPLMIWLALDFELGALAMAAILLPLATAMILLGIQPAKGAIVALQWWSGMHGFRKERPAPNEAESP